MTTKMKIVTKLCSMLLTGALAYSCGLSHPAFSIPSSGQDFREFQEAMRLGQSGNYATAATILRELQRKHPGDAYILTELGTAYMNNYNDITHGVDRGEKCFRRAIQLDPQLGKAYVRLAEVYDVRGDYETGIKLATKALTVKKPDWDGYHERACAFSNLKRDKEALADIEQYIKRTNTKEKRFIIQRATILENLKQYDRALLDYQKLLQQSYEDQVVFREVACLKALNRNEDAVKSLSKLIARNKRDDNGFLTRARLYSSMKKYKEAVADYSAAFELQPSTTSLKERADVYEKMGRKDLADKDRKEAERL